MSESDKNIPEIGESTALLPPQPPVAPPKFIPAVSPDADLIANVATTMQVYFGDILNVLNNPNTSVEVKRTTISNCRLSISESLKALPLKGKIKALLGIFESLRNTPRGAQLLENPKEDDQIAEEDLIDFSTPEAFIAFIFNSSRESVNQGAVLRFYKKMHEFSLPEMVNFLDGIRQVGQGGGLFRLLIKNYIHDVMRRVQKGDNLVVPELTISDTARDLLPPNWGIRTRELPVGADHNIFFEDLEQPVNLILDALQQVDPAEYDAILQDMIQYEIKRERAAMRTDDRRPKFESELFAYHQEMFKRELQLALAKYAITPKDGFAGTADRLRNATDKAIKRALIPERGETRQPGVLANEAASAEREESK